MKDVANSAILSTGIHGLQDHQQRMLALGVQHVLQLGQFLKLELQLGFGVFFVGKVTCLVGIVLGQVRVGIVFYQVSFPSIHE